jgi:hypothetical protein
MFAAKIRQRQEDKAHAQYHKPANSGGDEKASSGSGVRRAALALAAAALIGGAGIGVMRRLRDKEHDHVFAPRFRHSTPEAPSQAPTRTAASSIATIPVGPNVPLKSEGMAPRAGDVMTTVESSEDPTRTRPPGFGEPRRQGNASL